MELEIAPEASINIDDNAFVDATSNSLQFSSPINLDLRQQAVQLLAQLGYTPDTPFATSSSLTAEASSALELIYNYAFRQASFEASSVINAISTVSAAQGIFELVMRSFQPIMLDILARWLEPSSSALPQEIKESRLAIMASLASVRPDLWR